MHFRRSGLQPRRSSSHDLGLQPPTLQGLRAPFKLSCMSGLKPRRPNQICTVICPSAYHNPCIVPGALSRQDYGAGEEHRNLKMEDWAGDRLPLPAYHLFPSLKLFHKSLRSSFLHSTTQSRLRANGAEHVSPGATPRGRVRVHVPPCKGGGFLRPCRAPRSIPKTSALPRA